MKIVYKDKFSEMFFDEQKEIFYHQIFPETTNMQEEEYKQMLLTWLNLVKLEKGVLALINTLDFDFPVTPELQNFAADIATQSNQKKIAFIMPQEFITGLSIEQYVEEANAVGSLTRYFSNVEEAENWLLSI